MDSVQLCCVLMFNQKWCANMSICQHLNNSSIFCIHIYCIRVYIRKQCCLFFCPFKRNEISGTSVNIVSVEDCFVIVRADRLFLLLNQNSFVLFNKNDNR